MAEQQFSAAFREAFWETHGKACMSCHESVSFREMEIDHTIPESMLERLDDLRVLLRRLGLPCTFDLHGNENLALLCKECNSDKGDLILADGVLGNRLGRIATRLRKLQQALEAGKRARNLDSTLRNIARSVESGRYTRQQLLDGLNDVLPMEFMTDNYTVTYSGMYTGSDGEGPGIIWSDTATSQIQSLGIKGDRLVRETLWGLRTKSTNVKKLLEVDGAYVLRVGSQLRVIFAPTPAGTVILDVWRKSQPG